MTLPWQETAGYGSKLIVFPKNFLKKWIQKKDNEAPKYLQGKNR